MLHKIFPNVSPSGLSRLLVTAALGLATVWTPTLLAQSTVHDLRNAHRHGHEVAYPGQQGEPKTAILLHADGTPGEEIHYMDFDGEAIVGGDIILHVDGNGYASFDRRLLENRSDKSAARTTNDRQWPGALIPYEVDSGVSSTAQGWITDAMAEWESVTQLRFVQRTTESDYLYFTANSSCSSSVGFQGGKQNINVNGCWQMGNAIHEIGHAVGLFHEHTREDRDSHVEIVWNNLDSGTALNNYRQYSPADGMDLGDYDHGSIMHYGCWAGTPSGISYNASTMSIKPNNTNRCYTNYGTYWMGQRNALSTGDIEGVNMLYPEVEMVVVKSSGNMQGEVLYDIDATDASIAKIGSLSGYSCFTDIDFVPGSALMYGINCDQTGAGSTVFQFNTILRMILSAAPITEGGSSRLVTSIAFDPITDDLYAIDHNGGGWGTTLLTINPGNGQATEIGGLWGDHTTASSIAFSEEGKLYALDNGNNGGRGDVLFTIDIATAETREIGALNGTRTGANMMRFGANGTLYGSLRGNSDGAGGVLFLIDPDDASTRDIAFFENDLRGTSMAVRNYESVSPDYRVVAMNNTGNAKGRVFYEVNPDNASTSEIGKISNNPFSTQNCVTDLDYLPESTMLYALSCDVAGGGSQLFFFTEDLAVVSQGTNLQDTSGSRLLTSLAFDPDNGDLYGIDYAGKAWGTTLVQIDYGTGQVTDIATLWGDQSAASSIVFDPNGNTLYGINNVDNAGNGDTLFTINTSTGETTDVGALTGSRTRTLSLRFAPDGTLFGSRLNNSDGTGSVLFLIDPEDATTRDVGFFHGDRTGSTSMAIRRD